MGRPIKNTIAKITCPKLPKIIHRERLYGLLDEGRKNHVVWVAGPGGSGKTTLIASWLKSRSLPALWYQMDAGDADLSTFFYYLSLAAREANPCGKKMLPLLTPEFLPAVDVFSRRYFERLYGQLRPPYVLVFDNYQDVPSDSRLHEAIRGGLSHLPDGIQIVIVSRNEPMPLLMRLRANSRLGYIGWSDLKLTFEEMDELVGTRSKTKTSRGLLEQLRMETDGWAAGLVLMTEHPHFKSLEISSAPIRLREDIFKYFAVEVFERLKSETRTFLLKTAYLPKITSTMAGKLTGLMRPDRILENLSRQNFFTNRLGLHEAAYQYHPLFRDFLLSRAGDVFSSEQITCLKRAVARVLEEADEIEDAVDLYLQTDAWPEAARLICVIAPALLKQGRAVVVKKWVDRVPASVADQIPYLYYWRGICHTMTEPNASLLDFDKALDLFQTKKDLAGRLLSWVGAVDYCFICADLVQLDRLIDLLESIIDENPQFPSPAIEASISVGMFNALSWRRPHDKNIGFWEYKVLNVLKTFHALDLRVKSGVYLTVYYLWKGDFSKANNSISTLHATVDEGKTPDYLLLNIKQLDVMYAFFTAEVDTCLKLAFEYIELADKAGIHIWDNLVRQNGIAAALSMGKLSIADSLLKKIRINPSKTRKFDTAFYHFLSTWKLMLEGDISTALERHKEVADSKHIMSFVPASAVGYIVMFEILQESGNTSAAGQCLSAAYQIAHGMKSSLLEYMALVAEAHQALKHGDDAHGLALVKKAFALGREFGVMNSYWWRPAVMTALCRKALEAGIETEYVRDIIRKRELVPEDNVPVPATWPYPLKIFTLGRFEIEIDGKPLLFSGKAQHKPLAFLKTLIALGGAAVPAEKITDLLWPEADGYSAHRSGELALYRLRKLLRNDKAIQVHDEKLTLDARYCFADVFSASLAFDKAETAWTVLGDKKKPVSGKKKMDALGSAVSLSKQAISTYSGHFLPADLQLSWTSSLRDRMRNKFIQTASNLGWHWAETKQYDKAIECFQKGLEIDDLCEEFYQQLMICYHKLGRKAEAVTTYRRCHTKMAAVLNITPSSKTEEIYNSVSRHH